MIGPDREGDSAEDHVLNFKMFILFLMPACCFFLNNVKLL